MANAPAIAVAAMTAAATSAACTGSSPEAIGRDDFRGCRRSLSRSATSFRRYTTPDSAQKIANAATAAPTALGSNRRCPNSSPAKTSRFLVQWPGRSEMSRFKTKGRRRAPDATASAGSDAFPEAEVLRAI